MDGIASSVVELIAAAAASWLVTLWIGSKLHIYLIAPVVIAGAIYGLFVEDDQMMMGLGIIFGASIAVMQSRTHALSATAPDSTAERRD